MTFQTTQNNPTHEHFYIVEVDLPIITGKCEIEPGIEGYGTPLSCPILDETSAVNTKTYTFVTDNAPVDLPISPAYRCLAGITETATELASGRGLSIRGRVSIKLQDFGNNDPNLERASAQAIKNQGTFFGKWNARNIFENNPIRIKKYRKSATLDLVTDAEVTSYVGRALNNNGKGSYTLEGADVLSSVDFDQSQFPQTVSGSLRADINASVTVIPVDGLTDWTVKPFPYVVRVGDELMTALSIANNLTPTAELTVNTRGADIGTPQFTAFISKTRIDEHANGDEVFICYTADQRNIAKVLEDILLAVNIPSSVIPIADWLAEVNTWLPSSLMSTIVYSTGNTNDLLSQILENYLLDMWSDPVSNEIKLLAVSDFRPSVATLNEGVEMDFETVKVKEMEQLRYTRAFISYNKLFIADPEEPTSYKQASLGISPNLEKEEFYGKEKLKRFRDSSRLDRDSADLLVARYLQRYGNMPLKVNWTTQEKYRTFSVGDVVNTNTSEIQAFDGSNNSANRVQITKMQPVFDKFGRSYKVEALSFAEGVAEDIIITIQEGVEINLFILAGAPPEAIELNIVLAGGPFSSTDNTIPAIRAGAFAAGSKLHITCINGADLQSRGGDGAYGFEDGGLTGTAAQAGGIVYDAENIDTDIYLSGVDNLGTTANGFLRAPGGGGGGVSSSTYEYTGFNFDASALANSLDDGLTGITWDGTHFWLLFEDTGVYQFDESGVATGLSFPLTVTPSTRASGGIAWDGTYFWIVFFDNKIKSYDSFGVPTGYSLDFTAQTNIGAGVTFDGSDIWISGGDGDSVFKYTKSGNSLVYSGFSINTASELPSPGPIAFDGTDIWVMVSSGLPADNAKPHKYTLAGSYTGISFDADPELTNPTGMVFNKGLWLTDNFMPSVRETKVYKYTNGSGGGGAGNNPGLGVSISANDGDTIGNGGTGSTIGAEVSGTGGAWGDSGNDGTGINGNSGGLPGKGIVKSGATVRVFGDTPTNFINGGGDTPDV